MSNSVRNAWTPVASFATVGDSAWTPSVQLGRLIRGNGYTIVSFTYTAALTQTTAAGNLQITGCPIPNGPSIGVRGTLSYSGINKAGFTDISCGMAASSATIIFAASGPGVVVANVVGADVASGTVNVQGTIIIYD